MRTLAICALGALALGAAATAHAAGGPVVGVDGGAGVVSLDGFTRYVTLHGSNRATAVAELSLPGGEVQVQRGMRGYYLIPAVAYDGSGGGLSGDGKTLVLV